MYEYEFKPNRKKGDSLICFPEEYVVIDIETTGFDPSVDKIIEIAAIKVSDNEIIDTYQSLVKPQQPISDFITRLTGISNDDVENSPYIDDCLPNFLSFIGDSVIVGHNVNFDINFIYDNSVKLLNKPIHNDFIDTFRLSRKYINQDNVANFKLITLLQFFQIPYDTSHRALDDCKSTNQLFLKLKEISKKLDEDIMQHISNHSFESTVFKDKKIFTIGSPHAISLNVLYSIYSKCGANANINFYKDADFFIVGYYSYLNYKRGKPSERIEKALHYSKENRSVILSEYEFYDMVGLKTLFPAPKSKSRYQRVDAKSITSEKTDFDVTHPLYGKVCVFTGTLEKMQRKEAMQAVVDFGGECGNNITKKTNYLILGNNDYCSTIKDGKSTKHKKAEELKLKGYEIEIITENVFYDMLFE